MNPRFTPGPWEWWDDGESAVRIAEASEQKFIASTILPSNARLIAAAPELYDGCNAMLGLVQLILGRDDLSAELREALTTNHRIAEAEAATAKARGEAA
jgi:hypothetical protein